MFISPLRNNWSEYRVLPTTFRNEICKKMEERERRPEAAEIKLPQPLRLLQPFSDFFSNLFQPVEFRDPVQYFRGIFQNIFEQEGPLKPGGLKINFND